MDAYGNLVITWTSTSQDSGSTDGVYAQVYDANGLASGGEFRVNTTTAQDQHYSSVAFSDTGRFTVVWTGNGTGDTTGIFSQRYLNPGITVTPTSGLTTTEAGGQATFTVVLATQPTANVTFSIVSNDTTEGTPVASSLTFSAANWSTPQTVTIRGVDDGMVDGNVSYSVNVSVSASTDAKYSALAAASINLTNNDDSTDPPAVGSEFKVNVYTTDNQNHAAVATSVSGNYVVAYSSYIAASTSTGVYFTLYNSSGGIIHAQDYIEPVNTTTVDDQDLPSVAMDAAGNFVVVWMSKNQDGSGKGIYGQRFNAVGTRIGGEFLINTTTLNNQDQPTVAMSSTGQFIVAWKTDKVSG